MRSMLLVSLAGAVTLEPMLEPRPPALQPLHGAALGDAPLQVDAPVLSAEETPATPAPGPQVSDGDQRLIVAIVLTYAAALAVGGAVLCCCCFGIYAGYS